jgi:hypothetical protein
MDFPDQVATDGFQYDTTQPNRPTPQRSKPTRVAERYSYVVDRFDEGILSSLLFGSATLNVNKLQDHLNARAAQGYRLAFQQIEQKRTFFFGKRESMILSFERPIS